MPPVSPVIITECRPEKLEVVMRFTGFLGANHPKGQRDVYQLNVFDALTPFLQKHPYILKQPGGVSHLSIQGETKSRFRMPSFHRRFYTCKRSHLKHDTRRRFTTGHDRWTISLFMLLVSSVQVKNGEGLIPPVISSVLNYVIEIWQSD